MQDQAQKLESSGMASSQRQSPNVRAETGFSCVAVLLPCLNEESAIAQTVKEFQRHLPGARIYVCDNGSKDHTVAAARQAGAIVSSESRQGKGFVMARMFADVDAEIFLMADGDGTYDPASAPVIVNTLRNRQVDMVVGTRISSEGGDTYRRGHRLGNRLFTRLAAFIFGRGFTDMLSGYRCLSRRFVKSFPALSTGFEIETELTVHALFLNLPTAEVETPYFSRVIGGESKLRTYRDGWRIAVTIMKLCKDYKPLLFFGVTAGILTLLSLATGIPVIVEFFTSGLVLRLPSAVLAASLMVSALVALVTGIILDTTARGMRELKRLAYLQVTSKSAAEEHQFR